MSKTSPFLFLSSLQMLSRRPLLSRFNCGLLITTGIERYQQYRALSSLKTKEVKTGVKNTSPDIKDSKRSYHSFEQVENALKIYRDKFGSAKVPSLFVVPEDDEWDKDLWGMRLGHKVSTITKRRNYKEYETQFTELGIDDAQYRGYGWAKVKKMLLTYKDKHGDLLVPRYFIVPKDDTTWDSEFWGICLGNITKRLRFTKSYSKHRAELVEMGFDFEQQQWLWSQVNWSNHFD